MELKSESVEHIQLNHSKSFSTFQNKYLDSSKIGELSINMSLYFYDFFDYCDAPEREE